MPTVIKSIHRIYDRLLLNTKRHFNAGDRNLVTLVVFNNHTRQVKKNRAVKSNELKSYYVINQIFKESTIVTTLNISSWNISSKRFIF